MSFLPASFRLLRGAQPLREWKSRKAMPIDISGLQIPGMIWPANHG